MRLIAVTKTVSVEHMRVAYAAGIRDFGESRIQEALQKHPAAYPQILTTSSETGHGIPELRAALHGLLQA